ncbi:MAG TPA: hypothetical protein VL443_01315 [Cyclobacteriaceae bacterium]|nr:hypothetical protein [Cyclobacteriaceae bacterium]
MNRVDSVFIIASGNTDKKKEVFSSRLKSITIANEAPVTIINYDDSAHLSLEVLKAQCHHKVWQQARKENHKSVLVLEESFLPSASHYHILNTDEPWDLLYLGRKSHGSDIPFESGGLVVPGYSEGSYAYLLNDIGIAKLLDAGNDQKLIPVSDFLMAMQGLHPDKNLQKQFSGTLTALAPMKNFIEQDSGKDSVDGYKPMHPQLFDLDIKNDEAWVKKYINPQLVQGEFDLLCDEPIDNVYCFPLFTPLFCKEIIEEAEHFGEWTNYRHKDEAPIDIKLSSFGFDEIYSYALKNFLYPLVMHKYQLHGEGWKNLVSQNFIVRYLAENQGHLGLHNDGSYLSLIVTLNTEYEGGGTFFPKFKKLVKAEQPGYASIHPGLLGYLHGARPVTKGKRYIMASFFFMGSRPFADGSY